MTQFPGAPVNAEYTEEGWLIWGDEAWTAHEWGLLTPGQRRLAVGDQPCVDDTPEDEHRRMQRIAMRRRRRAEEAA